jgi:hypothetical protein
MYPVKLGYSIAKKRITKLIRNKHHAEALLTSVFTLEKMVHRTLKQLIVSSGFRSKDAEKLLGQVRGFNKQRNIWSCFDPENRSLPDLIGNEHWQYIGKAVEMRNNLVHGKRAYSLEECDAVTRNILELLDHTVSVFNQNYGYDGWSKVSIRKVSRLHSDPKVWKNA